MTADPEFRQRRKRLLNTVWLLLAAAFGTSLIAAFVLLGGDDVTTGRAVAGTLLALVAVGLAGTAVVAIHRFPDPAARASYPPGQLGLARVGVWVLAAMAQGPAFFALTRIIDRS